MPDSFSRAHALSVAGTNDGTGSQAVLVFESPLEDVGNDFHIAVWVHGEAVAGLHDVFIDHAQGPESHEPGIVISIEGKTVAGIEPAVVAAAALFAGPNGNHKNILVVTTISPDLDAKVRETIRVRQALPSHLFLTEGQLRSIESGHPEVAALADSIK